MKAPPIQNGETEDSDTRKGKTVRPMKRKSTRTLAYSQISLRLGREDLELLRRTAREKRISIQTLALTAIHSYIKLLGEEADAWKEMPAVTPEDRESGILYLNIISRQPNPIEKLTQHLTDIGWGRNLVQRHHATNPRTKALEADVDFAVRELLQGVAKNETTKSIEILSRQAAESIREQYQHFRPAPAGPGPKRGTGKRPRAERPQPPPQNEG